MLLGQQLELAGESAAGKAGSFWSADEAFTRAQTSVTLQPDRPRAFTGTVSVSQAVAGGHGVKAWLPTTAGPEARGELEGGTPSCALEALLRRRVLEPAL